LVNHVSKLPFAADNQIMLDIEVKDYARRMKTLYPELNIFPGTTYFVISHDKNGKPLISTCR